MKFVSAEWVHDEQMGTHVIKAIGDDGQTYWVPSINTDVPPWPEFLEEKGVAAITGEPPPEAA